MTLLVTMGVGSREARAADPAAERLYQEGRTAARNQDWTTACEKFRASQKREPAPGTLLNLGDCEEHEGKLVAAVGRFEAAIRLFRSGDPRVEYARKRASTASARIARLVVRLDADSPADAEVELDGEPVDAASLGGAILVDPGEHALVVRASHRTPVRSSFRVSDGETRELTLTAGPHLAPDEKPLEAPRGHLALAPPSPAAPPPAARAEHDAPPPTGTPWRTVGYVSLGIGAAGVAAGLLGGALTLGAKSVVSDQCTPGCTQAGLDAESRGKTWSTVGTAGFLVGGVGLATGAMMLLLAPSSGANGSAIVAHPVVGGAELGWVGRF